MGREREGRRRTAAERGRTTPGTVRAVVVAAVLLGALLVWGTVAAAFAGAAAAQTTPPAPKALEDPTPNSGSFEYAAAINPYELGSEAKTVEAIEQARRAGANAVTVGVAWDYLQPTEATEPNFYPTDVAVREARARGMTASLFVSGTPDWVHPWVEEQGVTDPGVRRWYPPMEERELGHWGRFVGEVAQRYGTDVARYKMWNEPNCWNCFRGTPGDHSYVELLRAGYDAVKGSAGPMAKVTFGGLNRNDTVYLQRFYDAAKRYPDAASKRFYFDEMDVHTYVKGALSPDLPGTNPYYFGSTGPRGIPATKALMEKNGDTGKTFFIGEMGYPTIDGLFIDKVEDYRRALFLKQAFARARELPYVTGISWFSWHTHTASKPYWTMLDANLSPNRTFQGFREATGADKAVKVSPRPPANGVVSGTWAAVPAFSSPIPSARISSYELFVDGRYAGKGYERAGYGGNAGGGGYVPVRFDSTAKVNGWHEFVIVAYTKSTATGRGSAYASYPLRLYVRN